MSTYTFHVSGTHCASCKILIEDILSEQNNIHSVRVDLEKEVVEVETDINYDSVELAKMLTDKIQPNGYSLSVTKESTTKVEGDVIWQAIPIGLVILMLFFLLKKYGILNLGLGGQTTYVTKESTTKVEGDVIWQAIPIGLVILMLFFLLKKYGILNLGLGGQTTYVT